MSLEPQSRFCGAPGPKCLLSAESRDNSVSADRFLYVGAGYSTTTVGAAMQMLVISIPAGSDAAFGTA